MGPQGPRHSDSSKPDSTISHLPTRSDRSPSSLHRPPSGPAAAEEYRAPTAEEWDLFLGHFEKRKLSIGICGRAFGTPCIHEHACIRCSMLRPDPDQQGRLVEIRDNLLARITEAEREGWLGELEGLEVSLAGAQDKLAQLDAEQARRSTAVDLGIPTFRDIAGRDGASPGPG